MNNKYFLHPQARHNATKELAAIKVIKLEPGLFCVIMTLVVVPVQLLHLIEAFSHIFGRLCLFLTKQISVFTCDSISGLSLFTIVGVHR